LLTRKNQRLAVIGVLFLTDLAVNLLAGTPILVSSFYSIAVTAEAILAAFLLIRELGDPVTLIRLRSFTTFIFIAPVLSNGLMAFLAAGASMFVSGSAFWDSWKWWAISNGIGNLLITPFILSWVAYLRNQPKHRNFKRILEGAFLFLLPAGLISVALFTLPASLEVSLLLTYLTFPFLAWAALRFQLRGVSLAANILAIVAVLGTHSGYINILLFGSSLQTILLLQCFLAVIIIPSLLLAVIVNERQEMELERQVLLEIMEASSSRDLPAFLKLIHVELSRLISADNFSVVFYRKVSGLFEEVYAVDQFDDAMPPSRLEKSLTAYVFHLGETLLLDQAGFQKLQDQDLVELVGTNSACWLGAPLLSRGKAIGVMAVQDYVNPKRYDDRDRELLTSVASQVALAIEKQQADEGLKKKVADLESFLDVTVNRELLVADLKKEVNDMLQKNGLAKKYKGAG
jgi:integral membrane sensor domain MASE1